MSLLRDFSAVVNDAACICTTMMQYRAHDKLTDLRSGFTRLLIWWALLAVATVLVIVGAIVLMWGVYVLLAAVLGRGVSALIIGALLAVVGLILFVSIKKAAVSSK